MTKAEKKQRIDKLWRKVRFIVQTRGALEAVMREKEV